ncbi:hypothetical protein CAPTEDRAFT_186918, partial [Capitella teleta]
MDSGVVAWPALCGNQKQYADFWNPYITLQTDNPDFTPCFQNTVLKLAPNLLFWLIIPIYMKSIGSGRRDTNRSRLNIAKMVLIMFIVNVEHRRTVHSSGLIFIYLLVDIISCSIGVRSAFLRNIQLSEKFLRSLELSLVGVLWILVWFVDIPEERNSESTPLLADEGIRNESTVESPELRCSFISAITYCWFTKLIIKAFKTDLRFEELYDLTNRDKASSIVHGFQESWNKELKVMLTWVQSNDPHQWKGICIAFTMFLCGIAFVLLLQRHFYYTFLVGLHMKTAISSAVYRKILNLSCSARAKTTSGYITNLLAVDAQRLQDVPQYIFILIFTPFLTLMSAILLWQSVGLASLPGMISLVVIFLPVNGFYVSNQIKKLQMIKMQAWESSFGKKVKSERESELHYLKRAGYISGVSAIIWNNATFIVIFIIIATYVSLDDGNILDPNTAFVTASLVNVLNFPLSFLPAGVSYLGQTAVSIERLQEFFQLEERQESVQNHDIEEGETQRIRGSVRSRQSVAYLPQQPWIINESLRNNILFGRPYIEASYNAVIKACALDVDLKSFVDGDLTEIGGNGVNLSGGQRQRVSLARSVYLDRDLYYLDDPLSAVDGRVGEQIFNQVIGPSGILKHKTRVVVTHHTAHLQCFDYVISMRDGTISKSGSYIQIQSNRNPASSLDGQGCDIKGRSRKRFTTYPHSLSKSSAKNKNVAPRKLVEEELTATGKISWSVLKNFMRAARYPMVSLTMIFYGLNVASLVNSSIWLSKWSDVVPLQNTTFWDQNGYYMSVYGSILIGQVLSSLLGSVCIVHGCLKVSRLFHDAILDRLLRAPVSFFDSTPLGRILNRVSRDLDAIDFNTPLHLRNWFFQVVPLITTMILISYVAPFFLVAITPIGALFHLIQKLYANIIRQLTRIECAKRSPIFAHFDTTLSGVASIRAYGHQKMFIEKSDQLLDDCQKVYYLYISSI